MRLSIFKKAFVGFISVSLVVGALILGSITAWGQCPTNGVCNLTPQGGNNAVTPGTSPITPSSAPPGSGSGQGAGQEGGPAQNALALTNQIIQMIMGLLGGGGGGSGGGGASGSGVEAKDYSQAVNKAVPDTKAEAEDDEAVPKGKEDLRMAGNIKDDPDSGKPGQLKGGTIPKGSTSNNPQQSTTVPWFPRAAGGSSPGIAPPAGGGGGLPQIIPQICQLVEQALKTGQQLGGRTQRTRSGWSSVQTPSNSSNYRPPTRLAANDTRSTNLSIFRRTPSGALYEPPPEAFDLQHKDDWALYYVGDPNFDNYGTMEKYLSGELSFDSCDGESYNDILSSFYGIEKDLAEKAKEESETEQNNQDQQNNNQNSQQPNSGGGGMPQIPSFPGGGGGGIPPQPGTPRVETPSPFRELPQAKSMNDLYKALESPTGIADAKKLLDGLNDLDLEKLATPENMKALQDKITKLEEELKDEKLSEEEKKKKEEELAKLLALQCLLNGRLEDLNERREQAKKDPKAQENIAKAEAIAKEWERFKSLAANTKWEDVPNLSDLAAQNIAATNFLNNNKNSQQNITPEQYASALYPQQFQDLFNEYRTYGSIDTTYGTPTQKAMAEFIMGVGEKTVLTGNLKATDRLFSTTGAASAFSNYNNALLQYGNLATLQANTIYSQTGNTQLALDAWRDGSERAGGVADAMNKRLAVDTSKPGQWAFSQVSPEWTVNEFLYFAGFPSSANINQNGYGICWACAGQQEQYIKAPQRWAMNQLEGYQTGKISIPNADGSVSKFDVTHILAYDVHLNPVTQQGGPKDIAATSTLMMAESVKDYYDGVGSLASNGGDARQGDRVSSIISGKGGTGFSSEQAWAADSYNAMVEVSQRHGGFHAWNITPYVGQTVQDNQYQAWMNALPTGTGSKYVSPFMAEGNTHKTEYKELTNMVIKSPENLNKLIYPTRGASSIGGSPGSFLNNIPGGIAGSNNGQNNTSGNAPTEQSDQPAEKPDLLNDEENKAKIAAACKKFIACDVDVLPKTCEDLSLTDDTTSTPDPKTGYIIDELSVEDMQAHYQACLQSNSAICLKPVDAAKWTSVEVPLNEDEKRRFCDYLPGLTDPCKDEETIYSPTLVLPKETIEQYGNVCSMATSKLNCLLGHYKEYLTANPSTESDMRTNPALYEWIVGSDILSTPPQNVTEVSTIAQMTARKKNGVSGTRMEAAQPKAQKSKARKPSSKPKSYNYKQKPQNFEMEAF